jgi:predicted metal-binding membrane protein
MMVADRTANKPTAPAVLWPAVAIAGAWTALALWGGGGRGLLTGGAPLMSGATTDMSGMAMPRMAAMPGMGATTMTMLGIHLDASDTPFSWPVFGAFACMWAVMIIAMMLVVEMPSLWRRSAVPTVGFVAAGLAPWAVVGGAVFLMLAGLQVAFPNPGDTALRVAAGLALAGAAYELTGVKRRSRHRCRTLCGDSPRDALRSGVAAACCCGPMMAVLALVGMMNLAWMAALTVVMVAERSLRWGPWLARAAAGAVAIAAFGVLVVPQHLPAFR